MKPTKEQQSAIDELIKVEKQIQVLCGVAGTGKSFTLAALTKHLPDFAICAYTGKAADVLRKKGVQASTIHSLIYTPFEDHLGRINFKLNDKIDCQGIIIDEASMVSKEIYYDLLYFKKPLIFVGDHGQLEPIGDDANVLSEPDFTLEKIHRNAGKIAFFAEWVRKGKQPNKFQGGPAVKFARKGDIKQKWFSYFDQMICGFNRTRVKLNHQAREATGRKGIINPGERVICLKNNKQLGLFNGMQGFVTRIYANNIFNFDVDDLMFHKLDYDPDQFGKEKHDFEFGQDLPNPFDYATCVTAHKSQGSEFNKVLVIEENCSLWDSRRWNYTCASRAKEQVVWLT